MSLEHLDPSFDVLRRSNYRFPGPLHFALAPLIVLLWVTMIGAQDSPEPPAAEEIVAESDPLVLSIVQSDPSSPLELTQAAETLLNLNRPKLAHGYLKTLLAGQPAAPQLLRLHQEFGSGLFLRISQDQHLQPEGAQLAHAVLSTAQRWAHDPNRIDKLVQNLLDDPSAANRWAALDKLQGVATAAVAPLVRTLHEGGSPERKARARRALVALGTAVIGPLIGFLNTPDQRLRSEVIMVLGMLQAERAIPHLLRTFHLSPTSSPSHRAASVALQQIVGTLPTLAESRTMLRGRILSLLKGQESFAEIDLAGMVTLWRWDATQQSVAARQFTPRHAAVVVAAGLATDLYHLCPDQTDCQRLFITARLASAKSLVGVRQPLPRGADTAYAIAAAAGSAMVERVLVDSMRDGFLGAAIAAVEVLGEIGNESLLAQPQGRQRPLMRALQHPNRPLRMAAARAIMNIDPQQPFARANHVTELLRYVVATQGTRRVLIGSPNVHDVQTLAGYLREMGFETDFATTGRELTRMAVKNPDYELLLISNAIYSPPTAELLQHLRQHPHTAGLPAGLLAQASSYAQSLRIAELDDLTLAFPRVHDRDGVAMILRRLLRLPGRESVSKEQRLTDAWEALTWLDRLADDRRSFNMYELLGLEPVVVAALNTPDLFTGATKVLAKFGTPRAQSSLVELASDSGLPIDRRRAAANALREAIARRNVQLTNSQIRRQYDRHQRSESLDATTQQLLSSIIDSLQQASAKESGSRQ